MRVGEKNKGFEQRDASCQTYPSQKPLLSQLFSEFRQAIWKFVAKIGFIPLLF